MFCNGACISNEQGGNSGVEPRGGCGVVFSGREIMPNGLDSPLENNGIPHSSNRAALHAVILGLNLQFWPGGGFESMVIACDSEYVVLGVTEWLQKWIKRGWKNSAGRPVANADLWNKLLERLRELENDGCHVQFWQIPREWNEAYGCANKAAEVNSSLIH